MSGKDTILYKMYCLELIMKFSIARCFLYVSVIAGQDHLNKIEVWKSDIMVLNANIFPLWNFVLSIDE